MTIRVPWKDCLLPVDVYQNYGTGNLPRTACTLSWRFLRKTGRPPAQVGGSFLVLYLSDAFMAYYHSYTGQIPPICLRLGCLLVKNDGTPAGGSFVLYEYEDRPVSEFAERIKRDMLSDVTVFPRYIRLWKPDPPISSLPSGLLSGVNALQLDQPGNERSVVELVNTSRLGRFFTANQQEGQIHVIAQLPLDREKVKGSATYICTVLRTVQLSGLRALFYRQTRL